jgi:spore coat polysaccharide biosynthesis protein SpsF
VSNAYPAPSYPDGLDVEVVSFPALERAWREARKPSEREHVTPYVWNHPELFRPGRRAHATDLSHLRWTVDEERDLAFMREVFARIDPDAARLRDVLALLEREPELARINSGIGRNEGYRKSLRQDAAAEKRS